MINTIGVFRKENIMAITKKQHKKFVVAKVHPFRNSTSIPGTTASKIELLDVDNNFKWHYTWVDENNFNFAQWEKVFNTDYHEVAPVIEGFFADKKKTPNLISADAKFTVIEEPDRYDLIYNIGKAVGVI